VDILANLLFSVLSGLLLGLSYHHTGGITPLAFVALVPLFILQHKLMERPKSAGRFFLYTWLSFLVYNVWTTGWLFSVEGSMATRLFSLLAPVVLNSLVMALPWLVFHKAMRILKPVQAYASIIFFWLSFEYLHFNWELTWTWLSFGNIFANTTSWIQWYEITGVLGGTLWVLLSNIFVFIALQKWQALKNWRVFVRPFTAIILPIIVSQFFFYEQDVQGKEVPIVLVQPNINPYSDKFDADNQAQLQGMIAQASVVSPLSSSALWLFPETAVQERSYYDDDYKPTRLFGLWENDLSTSKAVELLQETSRITGNPIISGVSSQQFFYSNDFTKAARQTRKGNEFYVCYNAAYYFNGNDTLGVYHKSKLVPGVEIMPYAHLLKPLGDLALDLGGTVGGLGIQNTVENFEWSLKDVSAAPIICYESVFGEHTGKFVQQGANVLCIITNDAWWGFTAGHKQHLALAKLRAIEHRRYVARCANTGISAFIDWNGQIVAETKYWEKACIVENVPLNTELTFYTKYGDYLGRISAMFAGLMLVLLISKGLRGKGIKSN